MIECRAAARCIEIPGPVAGSRTYAVLRSRCRAGLREGSGVQLTVFVIAWMVYNLLAEQHGWWKSDSAVLGFTALTLILSLQASSPASLILLAQNRQDDRDRVQIEQDRQRAERNLADTEHLAREIVAPRLEERRPPGSRPSRRSGSRWLLR
ncbi:MAG: DUF1003 domain-containing protein [Protaetiibacter sp.]